VIFEILKKIPSSDSRGRRSSTSNRIQSGGVSQEQSEESYVEEQQQQQDPLQKEHALLQDILVRRIPSEAIISDEKLPIVLALCSFRDSLHDTQLLDTASLEKLMDSIVKETPMQTTNVTRSRALHQADILQLTDMFSSIPKVHFSVDLSSRDKKEHLQILISFCNKKSNSPEVKLAFSGVFVRNLG